MKTANKSLLWVPRIRVRLARVPYAGGDIFCHHRERREIQRRGWSFGEAQGETSGFAAHEQVRARKIPNMNDSTRTRQPDRSQSWRLTQPWKVQPGHLLTIAQAAEQLGFTEGTVRRYCDRSKIGYITVRWKYGIIGRARRYIPKAAAQEFLQRRAACRLSWPYSVPPSIAQRPEDDPRDRHPSPSR
jgi:hypothetical protein